MCTSLDTWNDSSSDTWVTKQDTPKVVAHNGPVCGICSVPYIGQHTCRDEDIQKRIDWLESQKGQRSYADTCPCNPKNGGSGICGCILGGLQVTC